MNVLGVDPGYQTGLAVVDVRRELVLRLMTVGPKERFALTDILEEMVKGYEAQAAVVQVPMFPVGKTPRWHRSPISLAKNAQLAGRIAGFLEGLGLDVRQDPPSPRRGMKMPRALFVRAFGVDGSEHARDAAVLAMSWNDTVARVLPRAPLT